MFAKLVLFFLFTCSFGNCTLPSLPDSAITGTLKKGFHVILFVLKFNSVIFFLATLSNHANLVCTGSARVFKIGPFMGIN